MGYSLKDFPQHVQDQVNDRPKPNGLDLCTGKQVLFINKLPPGLNKVGDEKGLLNMHWTKYRELKKRWVRYIFAAQPKRHPGTVTLGYYRVSVQPMDWDNLGASFKPVGDALIENGVIEDDSPMVITDFEMDWEKADSLRSQGVRIEIESI